MIDLQSLTVAQTPTGTIIWYAGGTAPSGYLECDGSAVSRTTYATLFAVIGETFGGGDGSTTFNLPDLRGEFVRGWDHGRGVDSGRSRGSWQDQDVQPHSHTYDATRAFFSQTDGTGSYNTWGPSTGTTASFGTTETRPRNVALMACIKY